MLSLLFVIMCLHLRPELYRDYATPSVADLDKFDTCDYIYSVKDTNTNDLIILQLNIRGIYSKVSMLIDLLNTCVEGRSPDVVLLSELWLTPTSPTISVHGYDFIFRCRMHKRGGGIGILISKDLQFTECKQISSSVVENECVTMKWSLNHMRNVLYRLCTNLQTLTYQLFRVVTTPCCAK